MTAVSAMPGVSRAATSSLSDPADQAFLLLRSTLTGAPILFGLDKFANLLVEWPVYLAPWSNELGPDARSRQEFFARTAVSG